MGFLSVASQSCLSKSMRQIWSDPFGCMRNANIVIIHSRYQIGGSLNWSEGLHCASQRVSQSGPHRSIAMIRSWASHWEEWGGAAEWPQNIKWIPMLLKETELWRHRMCHSTPPTHLRSFYLGSVNGLCLLHLISSLSFPINFWDSYFNSDISMKIQQWQ